MKSKLKIIVVEDDAYFRADLLRRLKAYGEVRGTDSADEALKMLSQGKFTAAIIDLQLQNRSSGLDLVSAAVRHGAVPIVLTGNGDPKMVARAYELGCKHYFSRLDVEADLDRELGFYLRTLCDDSLEEVLKKEFISQDPRLRRSLEQLRFQNLNRDQRVLILGPTGVGKTKIAKLIHRMSEPGMDNFVHINMAEVPEDLAESILFGHRRGSFTGATEDREGFFSKADGGTLFLDEIGAINLSLQKKLLKVLEEKEYTPLGTTQNRKSDFRLISATCEDLPRLIESKRFRPDLYFRLRGIEINIPALSERRADIDLLIAHFSQRGARRVSFSEPALRALRDYDWHGNVRELEQVIRSLASGSLGIIEWNDLPTHIQKNTKPFQVSIEENKIYTKAIASFIQKQGLRKFIQAVEHDAFLDFYHRFHGNLTRTQKTLGISKSAVYRILDTVQSNEEMYHPTEGKEAGGRDEIHS